MGSGAICRPHIADQPRIDELNICCVTVDIGVPPIEQELSAMLPQGSKVSFVGGSSSCRHGIGHNALVL
jgi:hypothetical protein